MNTVAAKHQTLDSTTRLAISVAGVILFAFATALASQVRFPLPGTPVPATLQTTVVLLAALTMGARLGTASMLLYIAVGAAGAQVFALQDGMQMLGWKYIWGPTGGYLVGFVLAQPIVGYLSRTRQFSSAFLATLVGTAIVFVPGLIWLSIWAEAGLTQTLQLGLYPFLLPAVIKSMIVLGIAPLALNQARPIFCGQSDDASVS